MLPAEIGSAFRKMSVENGFFPQCSCVSLPQFAILSLIESMPMFSGPRD
jgi:hypothetical protein